MSQKGAGEHGHLIAQGARTWLMSARVIYSSRRETSVIASDVALRL